MNGYVYFAIAAVACGCAYGVTPEQELPHDAGIIKVDSGGGKDAQAPKDAGVTDSSVDLPDVPQQIQCTSLPLSTGMPSCDSCLGTSCCAEDQTCGFDQECMALIGCVDNCLPTDGGPPDPQCESDCESQYPNGMSEIDGLDNCMQTSCSTSCM